MGTNESDRLGSPYQGELSETRREVFLVSGAGGASFEAEIVTQLNATHDRLLVDQLWDGSLHRVTDPVTGEDYQLAVPLLYHDDERRVFALVLPEGLRHKELSLRRELLNKLETKTSAHPGYVRRFVVVFKRAELEAHLNGSGDVSRAEVSAVKDALERREKALDLATKSLAREHEALSIQRAELEAMERHLEARSSAPSNVPEQAPGVVEQLSEALSFNKRLMDVELAKSKPTKQHVSSGNTMVVSMDMLLPEEEQADDVSEALEDGASAAVSLRLSRSVLDDSGVSEPHEALTAGWLRSEKRSSDLASKLPQTFNRLKAGSREYYHSTFSKVPILARQLSASKMKMFVTRPARLFVQLHKVDDFPMVVLLLAIRDEESVQLWWPLDVRKPADKRLMTRLSDKFELHVALYGEGLSLEHVMRFKLPLELNAQHILQVAEHRFIEEQGQLEGALEKFEIEDYERLGSMSHNFQEHSFEGLELPSSVRLAAGILGYWSSPKVFRYLIENRSFSLEWFARIQERVVLLASQFGIALSPELCQVALDMNLAPEMKTLLRTLAATWAEVSLGLGGSPNDLDPIGSWENWQDLIEALHKEGTTLDDDLDELSKASLRRAQEFAQENGLMKDDVAADELFPFEEPDAMKALLSDPEHRLTAACTLLKAGGPVEEVLQSAEEMSVEDVETLSETLSLYGKRHEVALIAALDGATPTRALLCCISLSAQRSISARLPLLRTLEDSARAPDPVLFATTLTMYGNELTEVLVESLPQAEVTASHPWIILLAALAKAEGDDIFREIEDVHPSAVRWARERLHPKPPVEVD